MDRNGSLLGARFSRTGLEGGSPRHVSQQLPGPRHFCSFFLPQAGVLCVASGPLRLGRHSGQPGFFSHEFEQSLCSMYLHV